LDALIEGLLGDGGIELEAASAREVTVGEGKVRLCLLQLRLRMVKSGSPALTICPSRKWMASR
jgi:hypothetical protein